MAILQYNCGNANHKSARPFFDRLDPDAHHIVAVQEPYFNTRTNSTYCPPGYHLAYRPDASTRVCFMVSRALGIESWSYQAGHADVLNILTEKIWMLVLSKCDLLSCPIYTG